MVGVDQEPLRVLIADGDPALVEVTREVVAELGHAVAGVTVSVAEAVAVTRKERPDVALVAAGEHPEHALEMIGQIVQEGACPVVALVSPGRAAFVEQAARRGVFASLPVGDSEALRGVLAVVLRRFAEYHDLEGAFGRRAVTERAKGILMERHGIGEGEAFDLLRDHARRSGRKLVEVAEAVLETYLLLRPFDLSAARGRSAGEGGAGPARADAEIYGRRDR